LSVTIWSYLAQRFAADEKHRQLIRRQAREAIVSPARLSPKAKHPLAIANAAVLLGMSGGIHPHNVRGAHETLIARMGDLTEAIRKRLLK
ncbi:MAG TPA: hypothetical protein VFG47_02080, partial [Geminicoccaceae bacterium]|nr:hypothetical protein [Geminicoccaceae bacterium]